MYRVKFIVSFFTAFFKRFNLILILGVLFGVLFFLSIRFIFVKFYPTSITYIGVVGKYRAEDLPPFILSTLSEGLVKIDEHGIPQPSIAKSWDAKDSGKTWTFTLDASKKWQDGTTIKSKDIQYSFEDVQVEYPSDTTIVFRLKSAYAPFPSVLSHPVFKKGLLGTGDYSVSKISQIGSYIEKLELTNKENKHLLYRFYPTEDAAKVGYELGQVDVLDDVSNPEPIQKWGTSVLTEKVDQLKYVAIFFNNQSPLFKDNKTLRQALSYAIEKDTLSTARALSPVSPDSWAYNAQVKPYDYDKTRAQELLKTIIKKDQDLKIKLSTVGSLVTVADSISKDWDDVGIKTTVSVINEIPDDFEALLVEYSVSLDPDQYLTWHSTQMETNISHYTNPRIDKLLEDGRLEMDFEKRKKIYLDFQRFLLEDAPAVFLYHPISYTITRK